MFKKIAFAIAVAVCLFVVTLLWIHRDRPDLPITSSTELATATGFYILLVLPGAALIWLSGWILRRIWLNQQAEKAEQKREATNRYLESLSSMERSPEYKTGQMQLPIAARAGKPNPFVVQSGLLEPSDRAIPIGFSRADEPLFDSDETHLVTIGPPGTGKNTSSQTPALCVYKGSAFVIDPKGQLSAITTRARRLLGQEVVNINPFGVLNIPTACYNPLAFLDPQSARFNSDCLRIANALVSGRPVENSNADHFESSALALVNILIQWVVLYGNSEFEERSMDLISVFELLYALGDDKQRRVFFERLTGAPNTLLATLAKRWLSENKEVVDCISTAQNHLSIMGDTGIQRILRNTSGARNISFAELKRKGITVFLQVPPELLDTHGRFLRLLVMSALGEMVSEQAKPPYPVLFMLDEFAQLGRMEIVERFAPIVRDYKIRFWLILQNLPQLQKLYGKEGAESFLSSAATVQFFTPADKITADYIAERSGKVHDTYSTTGLSRKIGGNASGEESKSTNEHRQERYVLRPQDAFALPKHTGQILVRRGLESVLVATRKPYWDTCKGLYDPDPYHA